MKVHYSKDAFLDAVCGEVSFKEAHHSIREELEAHIDDIAVSYMDNGIEEQEALAKAVLSMGDPKEIGTNLNKVHKIRIQWHVVAVVGVLSFVGAIVLFFMEELLYQNGSMFGKRQLISIGIGAFVVLLLYRFNYKVLMKHSKVLYVLGVLLTFAGTIFGIRINNSVFFKIGPISFEIAKYYNLIFIISIIGMLEKVRGNRILCIVKIASLSAVSLLCLYINSNLGIVVITTTVYISILTSAILKDKFFIKGRSLGLIMISGLAASLIIISNLSSLSRITSYNTNSGFEGLPNNWADHVLNIILLKFGWGFITIIFVLFILLTCLIILSTSELKNTTAFYLSIVLITYLICGFIVGIVTNLGFISGVNFGIPFLSYGPTNYITICILVGMFLSAWGRKLTT